jgi:hypothetical protein
MGAPNYSAGLGYDLVTGRGTPCADLITAALAQASYTNTTLGVSASPINYGQSATLTAAVAVNNGTLTITSTTPTVPAVQMFDFIGPSNVTADLFVGVIKTICLLARAFLLPWFILATENLALRRSVANDQHTVKRFKPRASDRIFWGWLCRRRSKW